MVSDDYPDVLQLRIHGMDCAEEVTLLRRELVPIVGDDTRLGFDVLNGRLTVDRSETSATLDEIMTAIGRAGLQAELWTEQTEASRSQSFWPKNQRLILTACSGVFGWIGLGLHAGTGSTGTIPTIAVVCYLAGIVAGLYLVFPKAWRSLISLRPDMNLLMLVAVCGAVAIGEWFEGATVAFLFSFSLLLESWSVGRARRAIASLMDLSPPTAHVRHDGNDLKDVAPSDVAIGSTIVTKPGEKIPLDGIVIEGTSGVDQSPITGESVPIEKSVGSDVFAGTINGDGLLEIKTTKLANDTTLARIVKMVGDASGRRAPSERWVERFASVYTPVVMASALLVMTLPPLVLGGTWGEWFYRALVLLVIACPCALVISTPVSIVASLAAAARNGVLIKGGVYVEVPAHLNTLALDKTGTLTQGAPSVVDVVPLSGHDDVELLARAAALERNSNHPLARAIVQEAERRGISIPVASQFEIIPGRGALGEIGGKTYWLGSHRYLELRNQETSDVHDELEAMQQAGRSVVVVGNDDHVCGFISLADSIRPETQGAIQALHESGIDRIVMLTGDNAGTAHEIARQAGIDEVHAELLPEDKVAIIERLLQEDATVAMIGDGVNDAPALALASLGIAMGAVGSDAAIETADVALMSDDLTKLSWLLHHSRRTIRIIRQNVVFSLGVKAVFVMLTFAGFASLWAAIAADMGASLLVIGNGLRLLKHQATSEVHDF